VLFYSDAAELIASSVLSAGGENFGVDIPAGQWHTLEVLESGTVIFEIKEGPYMPLEPSNIMTI
jgi:cupin fold WbuC family metalloprotein